MIHLSGRSGVNGSDCILALGSNMGDRRASLYRALRALHDSGFFALDRLSRIVESEPWGPIPQGPFLNLLVRGRTSLGAEALLGLIQDIEEGEGRVREVRYGPRTIDIDIIFYGDLTLDTSTLTLPHPHWCERSFVHDLLGDVIGQDDVEFLSFSGVREALLSKGKLSPDLCEVESFRSELSGLPEKEPQ